MTASRVKIGKVGAYPTGAIGETLTARLDEKPIALVG